MSFFRASVASRLAVAFVVVCCVMGASAGVGIWRLVVLQGIADTLGSTSSERALLAQELHAIVVLSSARAETLLEMDNPEYAARIDADRKLTSARSTEVRKRLSELADDAQSAALFAAIDKTGEEFRRVRDALVQARKSAQALPANAVAQRLRPAAQAYADAVNDLALYQRELVAQAREGARSSERQGVVLLAVGSLVGLVLSVACAVTLSRSIQRPLRRAARVTDRISDGDLTSTPPPVDVGNRDELQGLLRQLAGMQQRLAVLVVGIRQSSTMVANTSSEIAEGNMDLSQRTEHTASNLEEIAASMEVLLQTVRHSAESAAQASDLAATASATAQHGREAMGQVVGTMDGISQSSRRIAAITHVIDSIAFQTNILALNAAVEAARAGDQGRGFAVVAAEVRTLAQRSATAAKEIGQLISASVQQVDDGTRLVHDTGKTIGEVADAVQQVASIIGAISHASREQTAGLSQVGEGIAKLDQVTQQNAALVEQSSAAAHSLRQQAQQLSEMVAVFRLPPGAERYYAAPDAAPANAPAAHMHGARLALPAPEAALA